MQPGIVPALVGNIYVIDACQLKGDIAAKALASISDGAAKLAIFPCPQILVSNRPAGDFERAKSKAPTTG